MSYIPKLPITTEMLNGLNAIAAAGWEIFVYEGYCDGERTETGVTGVNIQSGMEGNRFRFDVKHVLQWVDKETAVEFWADENGKTTIDAILRRRFST